MDEGEIAKRMRVSVGIEIANLEKLMESEKEDVRVFALDAFTTTAEIELTLLGALRVKARSEEKNPLARRLRLDR